MKKIIKIFMITLCFVLVVSCATNKGNKIIETDFVTGFVMDENRNPVPDYGISVYRNEEKLDVFFSDSKGMFCIKEPVKGIVWVKGEKNGYSKIIDEKNEKKEKKNPSRSQKENILFYQVYSADWAFDMAEKYILLEQFDKARNVLKQINYEINTPLSECMSFYIKKINQLEKEKVKKMKIQTKSKNENL